MPLAISAKESYLSAGSTIVVRDYIANMDLASIGKRNFPNIQLTTAIHSYSQKAASSAAFFRFPSPSKARKARRAGGLDCSELRNK